MTWLDQLSSRYCVFSNAKLNWRYSWSGNPWTRYHRWYLHWLTNLLWHNSQSLFMCVSKVFRTFLRNACVSSLIYIILITLWCCHLIFTERKGVQWSGKKGQEGRKENEKRKKGNWTEKGGEREGFALTLFTRFLPTMAVTVALYLRISWRKTETDLESGLTNTFCEISCCDGILCESLA